MPLPLSRRTRLGVAALEDRSVPAAHAAYAVTGDWGSGFQARVTLSNDGPAAVRFDQLRFALPSNITSVWDAKVVAHVGNTYTVTNAGWDAVIPAGGSVSFGFVATRGTSTVADGFVLNGVAVDTPITTPTTPTGTTPVPTAAQVSFKAASDWGTGLTGEITVKNAGTTPLSNWKLSFDFPGPITSLWNGTVLSRVGNRYTVGPASWNGTIPAGGSVVVGFSAGVGGVKATNFAFTADGVTPPPPQPNRAPVAVADSASTPVGQAVTVAVLANDTDADRDALAVTAVGSAAHGTVARNADGTVVYTPAAGYSGADSFTYTVSDGKGGTATGTVNVLVTAPVPPTQTGSWPAQVFAPYVDTTLWPTYDFVATARSTGVKYFTLAFIVADPQKLPAWGGYASYGLGSEFGTQMAAQINALRAIGGDVAVSFGGASGQELAEVITSVPALVAAYRSVIQAYGLTHIDFDIEGGASANKAVIDRRNAAVAILQQEAVAAGKELHVRYTLPVLPTGLTGEGVYVVQSAKAAGVRVDGVNVMAMDYGDGAAPNPSGRMGDYAIQAATSLFAQLGTIYGSSLTDAQKWGMIGVTPMIGLNDITTETFTQADARKLEAWADQHDIGLLAMWSLNRDRQNANGAITYVDLNSSSVVQSPNEFALIFNGFTG